MDHPKRVTIQCEEEDRRQAMTIIRTARNVEEDREEVRIEFEPGLGEDTDHIDPFGILGAVMDHIFHMNETLKKEAEDAGRN